MELEFDNRFDPTFDEWEDKYESLLRVIASFLSIHKNYEVDLSLVDEDEIHEINRDYRDIDRVTDVISFAFEDDHSELGKIVGGEDVPVLLGEIFICVPQALRQAKEFGNTPERELSFLFVHGMLHLLGYDHVTKKQEEVMFPLQEKILQAWKEKAHEDKP